MLTLNLTLKNVILIKSNVSTHIRHTIIRSSYAQVTMSSIADVYAAT